MNFLRHSCRQMGEWCKNYLSQPDPFLVRSVLALLLALLLLAGTGWILLKGYTGIRCYIFANRAEEAMKQKDWKTATFYLRSNLQRDPGHLRSTRLMVTLGTETQASWVEAWRIQLQKIDPANKENNLSLAALDLKKGRLEEARTVAEMLTSSDELGGSAENLLAVIALRENRPEKAREHFIKARIKKPDSLLISANYLAFLISSYPDTPEITALLDELTGHPEGKTVALRCRISWLLKKNQPAEALALAAELATTPERKFSDVLAHLALVARWKPDDYGRALDLAMEESKNSPGDALKMLKFLVSNGQKDPALSFLNLLPANTRRVPGIQRVEAELLRGIQDWEKLRLLAEGGQWEEEDPIRQAYLAHAYAHLSSPDKSLAIRQALLKKLKSQPLLLFDTLKTISQWPGWENETEAFLWELSKTPAFESSSLHSLFALYQSQRQALGLQRVTEQLLKSEPKNLGHQNNAINLALLTGIKEKTARENALLLYGAHPDNLFVLSTYSFSLLKEGKAAEALTFFSKIPEEMRLQPPFNFYYGLILHRTGQEKEKKRAWKNLDPDSLLDEEKKLWQTCLEKP